MHYRVMGFYLFYFFILFLFIFLIGKNWIDLERNTLTDSVWSISEGELGRDWLLKQ